MTLVVAAWVALLVVAALRGREVSAFSVAYNLPITLAFGALAFDLAIRIAYVESRRAFGMYAPVIVVWSAGALVLFFRLIAKSIDVSGHMTWAIVMVAQCLVEGAPRWFTAFACAIALQVLFLKLCMLGGYSGVYGLVAGGLLGAILVGLERARTDGMRGRPETK